MAQRRGFQPSHSSSKSLSLPQKMERGFMAGLLGMLLGTKMRRKAS